MPKKSPRVKNAATVKRELAVAERELHHITELQWTFAKRMLKFGFASWIFGMSSFFSILIVYDSKLLGETLLATPLFIIAAAAPIAITAVLARKFRAKIKRLEHMRKSLLTEYERAILKRVGEIIKK